jgi:hypothetical protein
MHVQYFRSILHKVKACFKQEGSVLVFTKEDITVT